VTSLNKYNNLYSTLILLFSIFIILSLSIATYYINYWPTDSYVPYIPSAQKLFKIEYLSHMHNNSPFPLVMRGKEALILGIAITQRLLNDTKSLFPNIFFLIFTTQISAIAIYLIAKKFFNEHIGFITYLIFVTSFIPYLYTLQGAHQPLVLMNFLLCFYFLKCANKNRWLNLIAGVFLGLMFFSSPTAPIFVPYLGALILYLEFKKSKRNFTKHLLINTSLLLPGMITVFLIFTIPDPMHSINSFIKFIEMSQFRNNFRIYHSFLSQYFASEIDFRGGGWLWILKYFFFAMPFLFTAYVLGIFYLLKKTYRNTMLLLLILISLSSPMLIEISRVVQFGRHYFPWRVGIIGCNK